MESGEIKLQRRPVTSPPKLVLLRVCVVFIFAVGATDLVAADEPTAPQPTSRLRVSVRVSEMNPAAREYPELGYEFSDEKRRAVDL